MATTSTTAADPATTIGGRSRMTAAPEMSYLQFIHTWPVRNLSRCLRTYKPGDALESPKFVTEAYGQRYLWIIQLYPNGLNKQYKGWLSAFLVLLAGPHNSIFGNYLSTVIDQKFNLVNQHQSKESEFRIDKGVGQAKLLPVDYRGMQATGFIKGDTLTLHYQLNLPIDAFQLSTFTFIPSVPNSDRALMFAGIESPKTAAFDTVVVANDSGKFFVDRTVLASASKELARLVGDDVDRVGFGEDQIAVWVVDIDARTVTAREILRFVYYEQAQFQRKNVDIYDIMRAAKHFDLKGLKTLSEEYIRKPGSITIESAIQSFLCSVDFGVVDVKRQSLTAILQDLTTAVNSEDWNRLQKRPKLLAVLLQFGSIQTANLVGRAPDNTRESEKEMRRSATSFEMSSSSSSIKLPRIDSTRRGRKRFV